LISAPILEIAMKITLSIAAAMIVVGAAGAVAADLPGFAANGFPVSPVQMQVVGAAHVAEMSPVADGPLASPHQIRVLAPHVRQTAAIAVDDTGAIAR
jgi:hypothetical protein